MRKYWKFILIAVVVAGLLYFLTLSNREGLTSNAPVANPLPGQGPQAGQGATMMTPPPVVPTPSNTGSALSSGPAPVTPPPAVPPPTVPPVPQSKDTLKEKIRTIRRDYEDLKNIDETGSQSLRGPLQTLNSVLSELESYTA